MEKKGQITYFILVGFLILLLVGIFLFIKLSDKKISFTGNDEFTDLENYIKLCMQGASYEGGYYIAEHGGHSYVPLDYIDYNELLVSNAYSYSTGTSSLLTLEEIESNYEAIVKLRLLTCVADFEEYKNKGFDINYQDPVVDVSIGLESVRVDIDFTVNAKLGEKSKGFKSFPSETIPFRLGQMYSIASEVIDMTIATPEDIQVTLLTDHLINNKIGYQVPQHGNKLIYFLYETTTNSKMEAMDNLYNGGKPLTFVFGADFAS